ncbi:MAG: hypothetical protein QHC40_00470 [Sphingobium sp.]|nr:hypothetical protein [Sphingobium sp.]
MADRQVRTISPDRGCDRRIAAEAASAFPANASAVSRAPSCSLVTREAAEHPVETGKTKKTPA